MRRWLLCLLLISLLAGLMASCTLRPKTPEPAASPPTEKPLPPPTNTPEPIPTTDPYADITHTDIPPDPVLTYWAYDCQTGKYTQSIDKPNIGGGCDQWEINFIERPVNQDKSLFYPHLDIVRFQMGKNETWLFGDLMTYQPEGSTTELNGSYALELDFDTDNDGDLLLMVTNPSASPAGEWTVQGVQVWEDTNDDVGGEAPVFAEETNPGDGYETLLFDQGLGDDPDLAWARIAPDDSATVDFAIKRSVVPTSGAFLWWTWASQAPLVPGDFDYNDTYGKDEIFEIGNSCRWVFDGPSVPVPNICLYERPTPEPGEVQKMCTISYTTGSTTISRCIPCPPECEAYNSIPSMSCTPGCEE